MTKMEIEEFAYIVETKKNFDEAVISVLKAVESRNWTIFNVYDIKERLAAKGFEQEPLKIIEICSGKHTNNFLNQNKLISLCMPCKINVFEEDGKVKIAGMKPAIMSEFFKEIKKEETEEVENAIKEIINNSR